MLLWQFQLIRLIPLLIVFAYAAYADYKTGEVANRIWLYAPVAAGLTLLEVYMYAASLAPLVLSIMVVVSAFSLGLFFVCDFIQTNIRKSDKVIFGGADSKALILLAVAMPLSPGFCLYVGLFPLVAFVLGGLLGGFKLLRGGFGVRVRFLPYFFVGVLLALV